MENGDGVLTREEEPTPEEKIAKLLESIVNWDNKTF